jgi:hypothetical protein
MSELSAEQAKNIVRSYPDAPQDGENEVVGAIFDQDEALTFLNWLCSPEARAIGQQIRDQREPQE